MLRSAFAALLCALAFAGLAACGGSSDDQVPDAVQDALSRSGYVDSADSICDAAAAQLQQRAATLLADTAKQPSRAQVSDFISMEATPIIKTTLSDLRGLNVPAGDENRVDGILDLADKALADLKADPGAAVYTNDDPFKAASKAATEYGFTSCGQISPGAIACVISDAACKASKPPATPGTKP